MCSNYKMEEKQLTSIISKYVKPVEEDNNQVDLRIFYRNKSLKSMLIRNRPTTTSQISNRDHVVYRYKCTQEGCNASQYIGYTTCKIDERFRNHAQTGSIKKHHIEKHGATRVSKNDLIESTSILRSCQSKGRLRMTEAVLIKELKPNLNSQDEGCDKLLKIFKH